MLAKQKRRHRRNVDRAGEIERHHVGERHVGERPVETGDLGGREHRAQELDKRPRRFRERRPALPPDERRQKHQRRDAADQQQLPDRIGRNQPFAERIVQRKNEDAEQHQAYSGHPRRRIRGRWL